MYRNGSRSRQIKFNNLSFLMIVVGFFAFVIVGRLFYLQVIKYSFYEEVAARAHRRYTELPAKRGEILMKDYTSGDDYVVAANITLDLVYIDPTMVNNKELVARTLTDVLFDFDTEREKDYNRVIRERREYERTGNIEAYERVKPLKDDELEDAFYHEILAKVSREVRQEILLSSSLPKEILHEIDTKNLTGIEVNGEKLLAYPPQIYDKRYVARVLSDDLQIAAPRLEQILIGENRYEVIAKKIDPEKSRILREIIKEDAEENPGMSNFAGLGFHEEYYRFYPEKSLAANVLGFVDREGKGRYGIEETFDRKLSGEKGVFEAQRDSIGRQITVGESIIKPAVNGQDIVLTIDRTIQLKVEEILKNAVDRYRADAGQIIVMDPKTSRVIAMVHYPTFDPNNYGKVYDKVDVKFSEEEIESLLPIDDSDTHFYFYHNWDVDDKYEVFKDIQEDKAPIFQRYKNWFGPEVYQNKIVSSIYEPGSVFKSITMASAIDDGIVTPNHTYYESEPLKVDEFTINNSDGQYRGLQTMTNVLEYSSNIGMSYVAKKMGRNLFYSYMMKFGLNERTGIEFEYESKGFVDYFTNWADSELVTHAFGQGISLTPLQMANAYCALANKGTLMHPFIVDSVYEEDGKLTKTEPAAIGQAISEDSANKITAMLVSAVENGVADKAQVESHYVAGKTGTSQTYKWGKPLKGAGTTIASFGGYAPIDDPQFVILVKLDHPRTSEWGSETAAPVFKEIATFLFDYYNIPPDKY